MLTGDLKNSIPVPRMEGKNVSLVELNLDLHLEPLWEAQTRFQETIKMDEDIFTWTRYGPYPTIEDYKKQVLDFSNTDGLYGYVIEYKIDPSADPSIVGYIAYTKVIPEHRTCEIGKLWLDPRYRRRNIMDEAIYLMLKHAFEEAKYRRVQWTTLNGNVASKKLAIRTQFKFEGIFRNEYIAKGIGRDGLYLAMIDSDWEDAKKNLETKLFNIE